MWANYFLLRPHLWFHFICEKTSKMSVFAIFSISRHSFSNKYEYFFVLFSISHHVFIKQSECFFLFSIFPPCFINKNEYFLCYFRFPTIIIVQERHQRSCYEIYVSLTDNLICTFLGYQHCLCVALATTSSAKVSALAEEHQRIYANKKECKALFRARAECAALSSFPRGAIHRGAFCSIGKSGELSY